VRAGFTPRTIAWAVISTESANWFPVARLSHLLDARLFGMRAGPQHITSVLIHALAALCLFAFPLRATRARWPSAFVAMLFALHPTHVESVAWVAERKDVLCALFWSLTLWAYVLYGGRPSAGCYLLVLLPLLDYWPLGRSRPYLPAGWLWYLVTLGPVIGMDCTTTGCTPY
jgi:hypothetical protein